MDKDLYDAYIVAAILTQNTNDLDDSFFDNLEVEQLFDFIDGAIKDNYPVKVRRLESCINLAKEIEKTLTEYFKRYHYDL